MRKKTIRPLLATLTFFTALPFSSIGQELLSVALKDSISGQRDGLDMLWQPASRNYEYDQSDLTSAISRLLYHKVLSHGDTTEFSEVLEYQKALESNNDYLSSLRMSHNFKCAKGILQLELSANKNATFALNMLETSRTNSFLRVSIDGDMILTYFVGEEFAELGSSSKEEQQSAKGGNDDFSFEEFVDVFQSIMHENLEENEAISDREPFRQMYGSTPYSDAYGTYNYTELISEYFSDNGGFLNELKKLDMPMRHVFQGGHFVWFEETE